MSRSSRTTRRARAKKRPPIARRLVSMPQRSTGGAISGLLMAVALLASCGCDAGHLRGEASPSHDGNTYLVVENGSGPECGDIIVDAEVWSHPMGAAGRIEPGVHWIDCGRLERFDADDAIRFRVPDGVVFRFDYWRP